MNRRDAFLAAYEALPRGAFSGRYRGRRYRVVKSVLAAGQAQMLEAEELGGNGNIGFNLYFLSNGETLLRPCEMPAETVIGFVLGLHPDPTGHSSD